MDSSKHWWESKTLWFNFLTLLIALSGAFMQFVGDLGLTDQQATYAALGLTLVSVAGTTMLRFITDTGIK